VFSVFRYKLFEPYNLSNLKAIILLFVVSDGKKYKYLSRKLQENYLQIALNGE
jgi:hypothetical protein